MSKDKREDDVKKIVKEEVQNRTLRAVLRTP